MGLRIYVHVGDSASHWLDWRALFDQAFPHPRFHEMDPDLSAPGDVVLAHACSDALQSLFFYEDLEDESPALSDFVRENLPVLLDFHDDRGRASNEIYPEDLLGFARLVLEYLTKEPRAKIDGSTLATLREELEALLAFARFADENVYSVRWETT